MALGELESMMSELFYMWNLDVNYNFEAVPNINSQTNVPFQFDNMMVTNLAVRLISAFNKEAPQTLFNQASQSLSAAIGFSAAINLRQIQPPRRMPLGNGNTFRNVYFNRFAVPTPLPPPDSSTNYIQQGETLDYYEDFSAFLGTLTISSFTITSDTLLTIDSSAISGKRIIYTITAPAGVNYQGPWQLVQITITDSSGRVLIRNINFEVITPPEVP